MKPLVALTHISTQQKRSLMAISHNEDPMIRKFYAIAKKGFGICSNNSNDIACPST
jgi:hypothetical protein